MKIDIFTHISPPRYNETLSKVTIQKPSVKERSRTTKTPLSDVHRRFEFMDKFEDIVQVLTLAEPPIEQVTDSKKAADLAKIANDELAELVSKHPDRFVAAGCRLTRGR
jgi:predicted TIM-barrel fold metal-dependent hydrolase